ncbi:MAG: ABC transporter permease [Gemmatimonadaceae bacterium]|nr:ABC transporter permease [Gemmatimonadaceae bacterium]MCW5826672.1 ABC transporter permease [Gemmatimonadaceae bacterium]
MPRTGLRFFRGMGRSAMALFGGIGARVLFFRELGRALKEGRTWSREVFHQMRTIGVDSLPLAIMVAAFIGGVITIQIRYQLFPGIQLSIVGLSSRQIVILETGPLLTGLVLAGRVGAKMTAEIATMRVTEQIDALETLAFDPVAYLIIPRIIAAVIMLPILTVFADVFGVLSGLMAAVTITDVKYAQFMEGVRLGYDQFQVTYSLIKATLFGAAIAFLCTYEGYTTRGGAEGVGQSTAKAVVVSSIAILILDAITAVLLAPYLQA